MKYLRKFNESDESYSYFDSNGWKKFLPKKLSLVTNNGNWELEIPSDSNNLGHATNVTNLMNCIQINYYQNTPKKQNGDVNRDGEPDQLEFDITIVKNNDGSKANPDTLKLNVDITYGDAMACEFIIEKPNKVSIIHYTGFGSKYDSETFFGFEDESLKDLVKFFNSWGFELTTDDFTFIDKYPDSYIHQETNESISLNPNFVEKTILILNNSKPQENRYLENIIKYLDFRGVVWKIASTKREVEKMIRDFNIVGAISSGSELRINQDDKKLEERLNIPILGICYGMQSLSKSNGSNLKTGDKFIHGSYKLSKYEDHKLFNGLDMETTQFSFSFNDYPENQPNGFDVIAELDGKIVGISNDNKKQYGTLFHPEDNEYTYKILDNFLDMCDLKNQSDVEDLKGEIKIKGIIENFSSFIKNI